MQGTVFLNGIPHYLIVAEVLTHRNSSFLCCDNVIYWMSQRMECLQCIHDRMPDVIMLIITSILMSYLTFPPVIKPSVDTSHIYNTSVSIILNYKG